MATTQPRRFGTGLYAGKVWDGSRWTDPTAAELEAHREASRATGGSFRVTTLPTLPGFRTVEALGLVSVIGAASGFTAGMKGNDALNKAHLQLMAEAEVRGANAVVGVVVSAFGAGGGITSVFGGDAVGVLLMGTAVKVTEDTEG